MKHDVTCDSFTEGLDGMYKVKCICGKDLGRATDRYVVAKRLMIHAFDEGVKSVNVQDLKLLLKRIENKPDHIFIEVETMEGKSIRLGE